MRSIKILFTELGKLAFSINTLLFDINKHFLLFLHKNGLSGLIMGGLF